MTAESPFKGSSGKLDGILSKEQMTHPGPAEMDARVRALIGREKQAPVRRAFARPPRPAAR